MMNRSQIDRTLFLLTPPMSNKQIERRYKQIVKKDEIPTIYFWNDIPCFGLIDYKLCVNNNLFWNRSHIGAVDENDMLRWVCNKYLENIKELDETFRKFVIGKLLNIESVNTVRPLPGWNHRWKEELDGRKTYRELCNEMGKRFFVSYNTIDKYGKFTASLEKIDTVSPELVEKILGSKIKMSHENLEKLAASSDETIIRVADSLIKDAERRERQFKGRRYGFDIDVDRPIEPEMKIKITPEYNPDVELISLNFTVRTWRESIERLKNSNLSQSSQEAKDKLTASLQELVAAATDIISDLRGEQNGQL